MKRVVLVVVLFVLACCTQARAQEDKSALAGIVLNAGNKKPIPGVAISVIDGKSAAITDDDGRFVLKGVEKGAILKFRMPGMANKEVVVGNRRDLTILMQDESLKTIYNKTYSPYGDRDWQATTGAVTAISNKDNYKKAATSSETLIQDEGLGVNTVIRSGMPGAGGNMYLWGFSSIYASSQPTVLIDGIPYENAAVTPSLINGNNITPLGGLEVKDIESITILKNATSLYGSKGANGVILIETSKAQEYATKIDFYAYAGVNSLPSNTYYPMMDAWEYKTYLVDMLTSSGLYTTDAIEKLPFIDATKPTEGRTSNGNVWGIEGNKDYYRYNQNTDWQKEVFTNSWDQNYYLSIKGGDDVALYALSLGYLNHEGTIKNTEFSRYSAQFNAQINVARWFRMNSNVNVTYSDRSLAYEGLSPYVSPLYVGLIKAPFMTTYLYNERGLQTPNYEAADVFGVSNPSVLVSENTSILNKTYRFFGNIGATADLGKWFDLNATLGVTFDKSRENIFLPQKGLSHEPLSSGIVNNEMKVLVSRYLQYYADLHLKFHHVFNKRHSVSTFLGVRYQTNGSEGDWANAYNSSSDDMRTIGNGNLSMASQSGLQGDWSWLSFYLNGEYSYNKRYFLSYNMAMDGSSRFGTDASNIKIGDKAYGIFPSVTGAWLASSEDFLSDVEWLNVLRLRLGYSIAGNDDIGNYTARSTYVSYNLYGFNGLVRNNIANPGLKWETNTKTTAGLDVVLFNDRLGVTFDLYQSKTTDLLTWEQGKDAYGIAYYLTNAGAMQNRGVELGVRGRIIGSENLKWDLGVNWTAYRNKVTSLPQDEKITEIAGANVLTKVGSPVGLFYGYQTNGVYATSADAATEDLNLQRGDGSLIPFMAGDMRFVNNNATDNIIDESDMAVIGDPNPDFMGSIVSKLQWKRFTFDMVWTYSYGNDIYNAVRASLESMTNTYNQTRNVTNRWSREGHITNTPRAMWGDPMGNSRFSDRWIEDGSYIRLKTISLSYDIPMNVSFMRGLQIYATVNNLVTFTNYLGYDPEFSAMQNPLGYGIDIGMSPQPRTVLLGIKLSL